MNTFSDRDCVEKLDLLLSPQKSLLESETQKYGKFPNHHILSSSESLVILKDRYLVSNTNESGANSSENICMDIKTKEKFLCKVITEPHDKVLLAYFRCNNEGVHKNIRPLKDVIPVSQDRTYLVLPSQHFGNLHTYIRDCRRLRESEARNLFRQICQTVNLCHRNGIVLRDLKLRKFFFSDLDRTKVQYESLEGSVILNDTDDSLYDKIGCPLYVAPELITTKSNYGGRAADIWALGVILYTMLIGKYPFNDANGQNLFTKILSCNLQIPAGISSKAKCLLRSLLRRKPEERLSAEDIFYHPWMEDQNSYDFEFRQDIGNDQFVPELTLESDTLDLT